MTGPLPPEFFPPADPQGSHEKIKEELKAPEIGSSILSEDHYRQTYVKGFIRARDVLLRQRGGPVWLSPGQIKLIHNLLYFGLYQDAGKWARVIAKFDGRVGADPQIIVSELDLLARQAEEIVKGWAHPADSEAGTAERLVFLAFYHARFVFIHPFRDGNGRVARLIAAWQEWCIFGPAPRAAVPRAVYRIGLADLPGDLAMLANFFANRHPYPAPFFSSLKPPFPVRVTLRKE